jgi:hypothetical protein
MSAIYGNGTSTLTTYKCTISIKNQFLTIFKGTILLKKLQESSIRDASWSKEALFGLLGMMLVILVPCIGFVVKYMLSTRASRFSQSKKPDCSGMFP